MLTQGEDVKAHALRQRGWSISAIARHLGRDRKTVRSYLSGDRQPGIRRTSTVDPLAVVEDYIRRSFADHCHVWASALYDYVVPLGYALSFPSFVRQIRARGLRPRGVSGVKGRDTIEIDHPAGEEIRRAAPRPPTPGDVRASCRSSSPPDLWGGMLVEKLDRQTIPVDLWESHGDAIKREGRTDRTSRERGGGRYSNEHIGDGTDSCVGPRHTCHRHASIAWR